MNGNALIIDTHNGQLVELDELELSSGAFEQLVSRTKPTRLPTASLTEVVST
ncbi:hypothetical protein HSB1_48070 [Halogranum salarium B-1]|uniref:Uncharacterized protein n=1 Tax=Halogranum salarium B-1 TaxID=1210908 RepID=J2Z8P4_9EURY|nr:hypothetical protein HSB1_48070 [Halogranum salarium B-1]